MAGISTATYPWRSSHSLHEPGAAGGLIREGVAGPAQPESVVALP